MSRHFVERSSQRNQQLRLIGGFNHVVSYSIILFCTVWGPNTMDFLLIEVSIISNNMFKSMLKPCLDGSMSIIVLYWNHTTNNIRVHFRIICLLKLLHITPLEVIICFDDVDQYLFPSFRGFDLHVPLDHAIDRSKNWWDLHGRSHGTFLTKSKFS